MVLLQILLPLYDNAGNIFPEKFYSEIKSQLAEKFGGITMYTQSPATGLWKDSDNKTNKDQMIIYEVIDNAFDNNWWRDYRKYLEEKFKQDEILIRRWTIETI
jgi:hypothetical protein